MNVGGSFKKNQSKTAKIPSALKINQTQHSRRIWVDKKGILFEMGLPVTNQCRDNQLEGVPRAILCHILFKPGQDELLDARASPILDGDEVGVGISLPPKPSEKTVTGLPERKCRLGRGCSRRFGKTKPVWNQAEEGE